LGVRDVTPDVPLDDAAGFEGDPAFFLVVVDADGRVEVERELEVTDESASLLAATPTDAILARAPREDGDRSAGRGRIVAHDLETGRERLIAELDIKPSHADVVGANLVIGQGSSGDLDPDDSCGLEVIDLASGDRTAHPLPSGCSEVLGVRVSPGGETVAVIYGVVRDTPELRLTIVDLVHSKIRSDELLGHNLICSPTECPGLRPVHYLGAAWDNDTALRVALFDLAANPAWNVEGDPVTKDELLIETRTVEGS
jgi:hypothetical protein